MSVTQRKTREEVVENLHGVARAVSYTHLTLPTKA